MPRLRQRLALHALTLAFLGFAAPLMAQTTDCPAPGEWRLDSGEILPSASLFAELAEQQVVLLGERHDSLSHHRWQLHTLSGLHAHHPDMVIGLEMLPREAQPALDAWIAGELDEAAFLEQSQWNAHWGFDPDLYLPILHFARMQRIPLLALNVTGELRQRLVEEDWDTVPEVERHAISPPAEPSSDYRDRLAEVFAYHPTGNDQDAELERFITAQLVWDRAMAQALADTLDNNRHDILVVGLIGHGHLSHGHGVPHQLDDLGITAQRTLLPWHPEGACSPPSNLADALFTLGDESMHEAPEPMRLGVMIEAHADGVLIQAIGEDSIAERAGLTVGDVITQAAGRRISTPGELTAVVREQAPGTLLPLAVTRNGDVEEVLAHFPVAP